MTPQRLIQFHSPGLDPKRWTGWQARTLVSSLAGNELDPSLFHYASDRLTTLKTASTIRWAGGHQRIGLIGIGRHAIDSIEDAAPKILMRLSERFGPVAIHRVTTTCSLEHAKEPATYLAANVVMARDAGEYQKLVLDMDDVARRAHAASRIVEGLRKQYKRLREIDGDDFGPKLDDSDWTYLGVRILGVGPLHSLKVGTKDTIYTTADVAFVGHLKLQGAWGVGKMVHVGLGHTWYHALPPLYESWPDYLSNGRGKTDRLARMQAVAARSRASYIAKTSR